MVKNPPANAGDSRDKGSIPGSQRSPGEGNGNPLQYSCLKVPWTEEPDRLQSMGSQSQTQLNTQFTLIHGYNICHSEKILCANIMRQRRHFWL